MTSSAATTTTTTVSPPVLRFKEGTIVVPGDRLGTIRQVCSGEGTYVRGGHIYASLVGNLTIVTRKGEQRRQQQEQQQLGDDDSTIKEKGEYHYNDNDHFRESLPSSSSSSSSHPTPLFSCMVKEADNSMMEGSSRRRKLPATSQVLHVGQLVVGKVLRITPQNAIVDIRAAQHVGAALSLPRPCEGAIRMEDVRKGSTEQVMLGECFRPGDIVVCRILSPGDSRRYYLSTAETELGVIRATTSKGVPMVPISWKEMECPETGIKELRKCAKPVHLQQHVNT